VNEKDLYKILGVSETASADEIKKKYRELAKKNHPDKTGGDKSKEQKFKEISAAYEVLSDPKRRGQYDAMRKGGFRAGPGGSPDFSAFAGIDGIEDLLSQMFGVGGGRPNVRSRVVYESRPFAGGNGGFGGGIPFGSGFGSFDGSARTAPAAEETVRTRDGTIYKRKGDDLHGEVDVSIDEAVLGAKISAPTIDGKVTITVPPGTSSGKQLRLRGKGAQRADGSRGDQYLTIRIVVPERVDTRAEELLREFAKRAPVRPRR
jgi:DnaJ-class molecular chaperone